MWQQYRPRRMRQRDALRSLIQETRLSIESLVMPLFVRAGARIRSPIPSLPGQFQFSVDQLVQECRQLTDLGVPAVLLFGLAEGKKDERGSLAYAKAGLIQRAVAAIKAQVPALLVITDVCVCAYTTHGHCGIVKYARGSRLEARGKKRHSVHHPPSTIHHPGEGEWWVDNEATLEVLAKVAVSHAEAGADMVAPSDMMDGNVAAIRKALDHAGHDRLPLMAYTAKFASNFYAPFRDAVGSAPAFGDRRGYQMDPANAEETLREARLDIEQGADLLMVKPALAYLDIIRRIKDAFHHPVAAFNVSGEYAMVKAAAARGWLPERPTWLELLVACKRAGADLLITYWAKEAAKALKQS